MKRPKKQKEEVTEKDLKRLRDIKWRSDHDGWSATVHARKMAESITDKDKAFGRYLAAIMVFGEGPVSKIFLERATPLGHDSAQGVSAADMLL